jgi:hypothetical protein
VLSQLVISNTEKFPNGRLLKLSKSIEEKIMGGFIAFWFSDRILLEEGRRVRSDGDSNSA